MTKKIYQAFGMFQLELHQKIFEAKFLFIQYVVELVNFKDLFLLSTVPSKSDIVLLIL